MCQVHDKPLDVRAKQSDRKRLEVHHTCQARQGWMCSEEMATVAIRSVGPD